MSSTLAPAVIAVELLVGLGLLLPAWRRQAALTAAVLLAIFTAAVAFNYVYGSRGICGCWFTITLAQSTEMHLLQNLMLMGLAFSAWHAAKPEVAEPLVAAPLSERP